MDKQREIKISREELIEVLERNSWLILTTSKDRKPRYMVFDPRYGEPARIKDWTMYPTKESAYNECGWLEEEYWRAILEVRKVDWCDKIG